MKKIAFFLIFVVAGIAAEAQDTVRYGDPWYIFKPMPALKRDHYEARRLRNDGSVMIQEYQNTLHNERLLYGIAITGSEYYDYYYDEKHQDDTVKKIEFVYLPSIDTSYPTTGHFDSVQQMVRMKMDSAMIKHSKFEYVYTIPSPDTQVVDLYEYYFPEPLRIDTGNFYIGTWMLFWDDVSLPSLHTCYEAPMDTTWGQKWYRGIGAYTGDEVSNVEIPCPIAWVPFDYYIGYSRSDRFSSPFWGTFFPIVQLRCTAPRGMQVEDHGAEGYVAQWAADTNAEDFEVAVCYTSQQPDNAQRYIQAGASLEAHIGTLSPDTTYRIHVRKRCSFTTSGYSDTVYGQWSAPELVMATSGIEAASDRRLQFSVQPNPASGRTTVELDGETEGELTLMDVYGRPIRNLAVTRGQRGVEVPLAGLSAGTYLLRLTTPTAMATRRLMVK